MDVDGSSFILDHVKKLLGFESDYKAFDLDILTHINSSFLLLNQMGVGGSNVFVCKEDSTWTDFTDDASLIDVVAQYIFLKTRIVFDPPSTSFLLEAIQSTIHSLEWYLNVYSDRGGDESG